MAIRSRARDGASRAARLSSSAAAGWGRTRHRRWAVGRPIFRRPFARAARRRKTTMTCPSYLGTELFHLGGKAITPLSLLGAFASIVLAVALGRLAGRLTRRFL